MEAAFAVVVVSVIGALIGKRLLYPDEMDARPQVIGMAVLLWVFLSVALRTW